METSNAFTYLSSHSITFETTPCIPFILGLPRTALTEEGAPPDDSI